MDLELEDHELLIRIDSRLKEVTELITPRPRVDAVNGIGKCFKDAASSDYR